MYTENVFQTSFIDNRLWLFFLNGPSSSGFGVRPKTYHLTPLLQDKRHLTENRREIGGTFVNTSGRHDVVFFWLMLEFGWHCCNRGQVTHVTFWEVQLPRLFSVPFDHLSTNPLYYDTFFSVFFHFLAPDFSFSSDHREDRRSSHQPCYPLD